MWDDEDNNPYGSFARHDSNSSDVGGLASPGACMFSEIIPCFSYVVAKCKYNCHLFPIADGNMEMAYFFVALCMLFSDRTF